VILPVHGFADHGMGLPLDAEEIMGSSVLNSAMTALPADMPLIVLPPLRLCLAPYPHTFFGVDAETALASLAEIATSVKSAGFKKLVLFTTSPWNAELISTAALEARVSLDIYLYVISGAGIGLGFHPTDPHRAKTQATVAWLARVTPESSPVDSDIRDADFRPGRYAQPTFVPFDSSLDGAALLISAADQLASLLCEISAHHGMNARMAANPASIVEAAACPAYRTRYLGAFTTRKIAELPFKENALVIIPTGAIEQHGHHLPLGTDAMLGQLLLAHALPKLSETAPVYVTPPITYGKSIEHAEFAGTVTITARTLRQQLTALATQLKALGFRQIAILNTHGGNSTVLVSTVRELQMSLDLRIGILSGYYKPEQTPQEAAFGFHAGEWETSLMLAGAPELVKMDRAVCEYPARLDDPGLLRPEAAPAVFAWKTGDISKSGVMGNATLATEEKGRRWLDEASTALAGKIQSLIG